jgi:hypothetical protein
MELLLQQQTRRRNLVTLEGEVRKEVSRLEFAVTLTPWGLTLNITALPAAMEVMDRFIQIFGSPECSPYCAASCYCHEEVGTLLTANWRISEGIAKGMQQLALLFPEYDLEIGEDEK